MGILFMIIGTSFASFAMEFANEFRMFKDVADAGYKVDFKKLSDFNKQINPNAAKIQFLSFLIPIFNLFVVMDNVLKYNKVRPYILDQLYMLDALEEMTDEEKQEYAERPTGLNAVLIPLKSEIRLANADSLKIEDEYGTSEVYYEMGENLDDITILKRTGSFKNMSIKEIKEKIINSLGKILDAAINEYGDIESFDKVLKDNPKIKLSNSNQEKQEMTNKEKPELSENSLNIQEQSIDNFENSLDSQETIDKKQKKVRKRIMK